MNKTEARYADVLACWKLAGEIADFRFEAVKLRLAEKCCFTPDFLMIMPDGRIRFHEVKGRKGAGYYAKDDALVKIKAATALFPWWRFFIVWPGDDQHWQMKEIKP
jgi:hypothetical protein